MNIGQLDFRTVPGARLDGCATYRDQIAVLVPSGDETRLVIFDRNGKPVREHMLPRLVSMRLEAFAAIPGARLSFAGELPRYVPLVAEVGDHDTQPILVDMETGSVVSRGERGTSVEVLRDGDLAYVRPDWKTIQQFAPDTHEAIDRTVASLGVAEHVGGGFVWTCPETTVALDAPGIRATRLQPRSVTGASR